VTTQALLSRKCGESGWRTRFPEGALEASQHDEPDRVALRRRPPADHGGQAVQAGGECDGAIWRTLLIAERTFRRLDAVELLAEVAEGVTNVNGVRVKRRPATADEKAAA
jgi:hypothetical protein